MSVLNDVGFALQSGLVYLIQSPWLLASLIVYGGCFSVLASQEALRAHSGAGTLLVDELASVATLAWNPLEALSVDGVIILIGVWLLLVVAASLLVNFRHRWENVVGKALFRHDSMQVLFKHFLLPEIERETFLLFCVSLFSMLFDALLLTVPQAASSMETARCALFTIVGALIFHALCSGFIFDSRNSRIRYSGLLTWWFVNGISRFYTVLADHPNVTVLGLVTGSWRHLPVILLIGCLSTMPVTWVAGWAARKWPGQDLSSVGCRIGAQTVVLALCSLWAAQSATLGKDYVLTTAYRLSPASLWMGTLIILFVGGYFAARYWHVIHGFYQASAIGLLQFEKCSSFQVIYEGIAAAVYSQMYGNPSTGSALPPGEPRSANPLIEFLRHTGRHMAAINIVSAFLLSGERDLKARIQCKLRVSSSGCPRDLLLRKPTFEVILVFRTKPRRFWEPAKEEKLLATIDLQKDVQVQAGVETADLDLEALVTIRFDTVIQLLKAVPNAHLDGFGADLRLPAVLASMADTFLPLDDMKLDLVFRSSGALPDYRMPLLGSQGSASTPVKFSAEHVGRLNRMLQDYSTRLVDQMHQPQFLQVKQRVQEMLDCKDDTKSVQLMTNALYSICQLAATVSPADEEVVVPILARVVAVIQQQFFKRVLGSVLKQRSRATLATDVVSIVVFVGVQGLWNATFNKTVHGLFVTAIAQPAPVTDGVAPTFEEEPPANETGTDAPDNPVENPITQSETVVSTAEALSVVPNAMTVAAAAIARQVIAAAENAAKDNGEAFKFPDAAIATWSPAQQRALNALRNMVARRTRLLPTGITNDAFLNNVDVPHSLWANNVLRTTVLEWGDCDWRNFDEHLFQHLLDQASPDAVAVVPAAPRLRPVLPPTAESKSNQSEAGPKQAKTGMAAEIAQAHADSRQEFLQQNLHLLFALFTRILTETFGIEPGGPVDKSHIATMLKRLKEWSKDADELQLDSEDYWDYYMRELVNVEQQQMVKRAAIRMQALRQLYTCCCHLQAQRQEMVKFTGQQLTATLQSSSLAGVQEFVRQFVKFLAGLQEVLVTIFPESPSQDSMLHCCNQFLQTTAARSLHDQEHEAICNDMQRCFQSLQTSVSVRWTKLNEEHQRHGSADKARSGSQRIIAFCTAMQAVQKVFQSSAAKLKWAPVGEVDQVFATFAAIRSQAEALLTSLPAPTPATATPLRPGRTATTPACRHRSPLIQQSEQ